MNQRKDLFDITFLIPVRIDSIERLQNLRAVTNHLLSLYDTNILILEADCYNNGLLNICLSPEIKIYFLEDANPIFHRTKYINMLARKVTTPYLAVWDSDVIVSDEQIRNALDLLKSKQADFSFPYDGMFLDTGMENRLEFLKSANMKPLQQFIYKMFPLYGHHSAGGGFLANTATYKQSGMENENFFGWGPEDGERVKRWDILGLNAKRVSGPMFHLSHPRGINSGKRPEEDLKTGIREYLRICKMSKDDLESELLTWHADQVTNEIT